MATAQPKNPVEKRLAYLAGLWDEFTRDKHARLLRWLVDPDEARLLQVFVELQGHAWDMAAPDLFINFSSPFEHFNKHAIQLNAELLRRYDSSREESDAQDGRQGWRPLPQSNGSFLENLKSFQGYHADSSEHIVAVLAPTSVADHSAYSAWIASLIAAGFSEDIRLIVSDDKNMPWLAELANRFPKQIRTIEPKLNTSAIVREIVSQSGASGPGAEYRRLFIDLSELVAKDNPETLREKAIAAVKIARQEGWLDQQVVIYMLVAAAHFKAKRSEEAIACYRKAATIAETAVSQQHPAGRKLLAQALFGHAAVFIADERYDDAIKIYEQATDAARKIPDPTLTIEGLRMVAYCFEQRGDRVESWRRGWAVFEEGEKLDADARKHTTLAFAAQGLMRIVEAQFAAESEKADTELKSATREAEQEADQAKARLGNNPAPGHLATITQQFEARVQAAERSAQQLNQEASERKANRLGAVRERIAMLMGENWDAQT